MRIAALAALAASLVLVAGCGGAAKTASDKPSPTAKPSPTTFTVKGRIDLGDGFTSDSGNDTKGEHCEGDADGGYDDISDGAQVTVYDNAGKAVGLGALLFGQIAGGGTVCRFPFIVRDVPIKGSIYSVEVTHRGKINFNRSEATSLALSLG
jgi:hypothetical protein